MEAFIMEQLGKNPQMGAQEALLLVYDSAAGAGEKQEEYQMVTQIEAQGSRLLPQELLAPYVEALGGGYCRMNLSVLQLIPAALLGRMVINSCRPYNEALFAQGVHILNRLCAQGAVAFSAQRLHKLVKDYAFLPKEAPPYRVVEAVYGKYLDVFLRVSRLLYQGGEVTVAIEGPSAAGKSTLAGLLIGVFGGNCFCTTEFMQGGFFDRARFQKDILMQLNSGKAFSYKSLTNGVETHKQVMPSRLNIVQGLYSMHPSLEKYYELKLFLSVTPLTQTKRLLAHKGEAGLRQFAKHTAPKESAYLQSAQAELRCDCVFYA